MHLYVPVWIVLFFSLQHILNSDLQQTGNHIRQRGISSLLIQPVKQERTILPCPYSLQSPPTLCILFIHRHTDSGVSVWCHYKCKHCCTSRMQRRSQAATAEINDGRDNECWLAPDRPITADRNNSPIKTRALGSQSSHHKVNISYWDGATTSWHKSGF